MRTAWGAAYDRLSLRRQPAPAGCPRFARDRVGLPDEGWIDHMPLQGPGQRLGGTRGIAQAPAGGRQTKPDFADVMFGAEVREQFGR